jgi:hypothetical protein
VESHSPSEKPTSGGTHSLLTFNDTPPAPCPPSKAKLKAWRDAGADPAEKPRTFFRLSAVFERAA